MNLNTTAGELTALAADTPEVVRLRPAGTDASNATRPFSKIRLVESFPVATEGRHHEDLAALFPAEYIARSNEMDTSSWVNLHCRYSAKKSSLAYVWQASNVPMYMAVNTNRASSVDELRTAALHPATASFEDRYAPHAKPRFVHAKPLAVKLARTGETDGCIGAVAVVNRAESWQVPEISRPFWSGSSVCGRKPQ